MKRLVSKGYFERQQIDLWLDELQSGNNSRAKRALQEIERNLRLGWHFPPQDLRRVQQVFIGVLSDGSSDEKVRRWSLSALAKFAQKDISYRAISGVLRDHSNEPQVVSSAIAALYRMDRVGTPDFLSSIGSISPEMIFLSAIQSLPHAEVSGPRFVLDPEDCDPLNLRLALIAAGLDRAPENLFHPHHENRLLIKALGRHEDPIVAQYAVWATMESSSLGVEDLGVDVGLLSHMPSNIRGYTYRLYARAPEVTLHRHRVIEEGAWEDDVECRFGLAAALKGQHYNGLEEIARNWVYREVDEDTQDAILAYMASASDEVLEYKSICLDFFEKSRLESLRRKRIISGAIRKPLFRELRKIEIEEGDSLFNRSEPRIVNTFNQTNNNAQGVFSQGGNVTQESQVNNMMVGFNPEQLGKLIASVRDQLQLIRAANLSLDDVNAAILELEAQPTQDNALKTANAIKEIGGALKGTVEFGASAASLIDYANKLLAFFSS